MSEEENLERGLSKKGKLVWKNYKDERNNASTSARVDGFEYEMPLGDIKVPALTIRMPNGFEFKVPVPNIEVGKLGAQRHHDAIEALIPIDTANLVDALQEIEKGEGAYNTDQLKFAENCVENMKGIASKALLKMRQKKENKHE